MSYNREKFTPTEAELGTDFAAACVARLLGNKPETERKKMKSENVSDFWCLMARYAMKESIQWVESQMKGGAV